MHNFDTTLLIAIFVIGLLVGYHFGKEAGYAKCLMTRRDDLDSSNPKTKHQQAGEEKRTLHLSMHQLPKPEQSPDNRSGREIRRVSLAQLEETLARAKKAQQARGVEMPPEKQPEPPPTEGAPPSDV